MNKVAKTIRLPIIVCLFVWFEVQAQEALFHLKMYTYKYFFIIKTDFYKEELSVTYIKLDKSVEID